MATPNEASALLAPTPHARSYWRGDIDGLRAVAVLAVLIYHVDSAWCPGGFMGVDVFFVISGFVVAGSLLRDPGGGLLAFYARRYKRLSPALVTATCVSALVLALVSLPNDELLPGFYLTGAFGLVGGANIYLLAEGVDYFDQGGEGIHRNPFMHLVGARLRAFLRSCRL